VCGLRRRQRDIPVSGLHWQAGPVNTLPSGARTVHNGCAVAKRQSRRTISIVREIYVGLSAVSAERQIPLSQLIAQAAQAVIAGQIDLRPARSQYELCCETNARRAASKPVRTPAPMPPDPVGTCAVCVEERPVRMTALEDGGPVLYRLCAECRGEDVAA
jgi:hypothetical protein